MYCTAPLSPRKGRLRSFRDDDDDEEEEEAVMLLCVNKYMNLDKCIKQAEKSANTTNLVHSAYHIHRWTVEGGRNSNMQWFVKVNR